MLFFSVYSQISHTCCRTLSFTMALCFFVVLCIDRTVLFSTYSLVDSVFSSHLTLSKIEAFLTPQIKHPEPKSFGEYFFVLVFTITLLVWVFLVIMMFSSIVCFHCLLIRFIFSKTPANKLSNPNLLSQTYGFFSSSDRRNLE